MEIVKLYFGIGAWHGEIGKAGTYEWSVSPTEKLVNHFTLAFLEVKGEDREGIMDVLIAHNRGYVDVL